MAIINKTEATSTTKLIPCIMANGYLRKPSERADRSKVVRDENIITTALKNPSLTE